MVPDLWMLGVNFRSDVSVPEQHFSSQGTDVPCALGTRHFVCSALHKGMIFLTFVSRSGKAFIFPAVIQIKLESLSEKSLLSDSSSVIWEE